MYSKNDNSDDGVKLWSELSSVNHLRYLDLHSSAIYSNWFEKSSQGYAEVKVTFALGYKSHVNYSSFDLMIITAFWL